MPNVAHNSFGLVAVVLVTLSACSKPQPAVRVTTREGGAFLIAHPIAKYERFCSDRSVSVRGDPDYQGLRIAGTAAKDSESSSISWSTIASIDLRDPVGNLGDGRTYGLCEGSPTSVNATYTIHDPNRTHHQS